VSPTAVPTALRSIASRAIVLGCWFDCSAGR